MRMEIGHHVSSPIPVKGTVRGAQRDEKGGTYSRGASGGGPSLWSLPGSRVFAEAVGMVADQVLLRDTNVPGIDPEDSRQLDLVA